MYLIVYDIADDKLRTRFSKFLTKFGRRLQYSVFEIANSPRMLANIRTALETEFSKKFGQADSVLVVQVPDNAVIHRYGHAVNEEHDLLFF